MQESMDSTIVLSNKISPFTFLSGCFALNILRRLATKGMLLGKTQHQIPDLMTLSPVKRQHGEVKRTATSSRSHQDVLTYLNKIVCSI